MWLTPKKIDNGREVKRDADIGQFTPVRSRQNSWLSPIALQLATASGWTAPVTKVSSGDM